MKSIIESKTIWLNSIYTLILSLEAVRAVDLLTATQLIYLGLAITILNIILRIWFTDTKINL